MTNTSLISRNTELTPIKQKTKSLSKANITEVPTDMSSGRFLIIEERDLEKRIDRKVEEKIQEILQSKERMYFKKINDIEARKEITDFILHMKKMGVSKINILDIVSSLCLPPNQIEKIMSAFEKEKKVKKVL